MNETTVTVVGNIASDVTSKRVGQEEHLLVTFRVASSERRWDKVTGGWFDGDRFSASVNCWRRLAEGALLSLVKGDPVVVTGRLSVREYEVDGERRFSTEIAAVSVGPDLARSSAKVTRRRPPSEAQPEQAESGQPNAELAEGASVSSLSAAAGENAGESESAGEGRTDGLHDDVREGLRATA